MAVQYAFEALGITFYQNDDGDTGVVVRPFTLSLDESIGEFDRGKYQVTLFKKG